MTNHTKFAAAIDWQRMRQLQDEYNRAMSAQLHAMAARGWKPRQFTRRERIRWWWADKVDNLRYRLCRWLGCEQ